MPLARFTLSLLLPLSISASVAAEGSPPTKDKAPCQGIPHEKWGAADLTRPQDIKMVQEIRPEPPVSETDSTTERYGARILLRAQPGMTAEWLQRIAECHVARGAVSTPPAQSPLDVKGASVTVQTVGDGFAVDITAADRVAGKQIFARAQAIVPPASVSR